MFSGWIAENSDADSETFRVFMTNTGWSTVTDETNYCKDGFISNISITKMKDLATEMFANDPYNEEPALKDGGYPCSLLWNFQDGCLK
jgi:hypothetical protein